MFRDTQSELSLIAARRSKLIEEIGSEQVHRAGDGTMPPAVHN